MIEQPEIILDAIGGPSFGVLRPWIIVLVSFLIGALIIGPWLHRLESRRRAEQARRGATLRTSLCLELAEQINKTLKRSNLPRNRSDLAAQDLQSVVELPQSVVRKICAVD